MDLEALEIARKLNKKIYFLEKIEEQIDALEGIPVNKIINFFQKVEFWDSYIKTYEKLYLKGAWNSLINSTHEFPTRCESIIDKRDQILFERMFPFLEKGNALVLVGITHTPGIIDRAVKNGFSVNFFSKKNF